MRSEYVGQEEAGHKGDGQNDATDLAAVSHSEAYFARKHRQNMSNRVNISLSVCIAVIGAFESGKRRVIQIECEDTGKLICTKLCMV